MSASQNNDPLEDRFGLIREDNYWSQTGLTNISFLSSIYNLASHSKYFIIGRPANSYWGSGVSEPVDLEQFAVGKLDGDLGLWLSCGDLEPEPLARWTGSTFPKRDVLRGQMQNLQASGSIVLSPFYMGQIDKEITAYFKAKDKLTISNPSHPALKFAPNDASAINKVELLWLQYWNIALQRRENKSFKLNTRKLNYSQRIPLVGLDLPMDKKVLFSEMAMNDCEKMLSHANIPNEWITNIYDFKTTFNDRSPDWAMPEVMPR
jgi:hypothetical protein